MERLNDKDYLVADTTYRSYYEVKPDKIVINDAVWNSQEIGEQPGDDVFRALINNPLVIRSSAIEQLTLGPYAATVPSTANFSRWEHVWGGVLLTRSLTENQDMTPEEKTTYQLRAFVSDLGHTAQSHLGDWISQGVGGQEDLHDSDLTNLLGVSGVNRILNYYGHNPDDIIFPDITDFVERPSPDLCIDRLDYSAREIRRWLNLSQDINEATTPQSFELIDGEIVMSSHWLAKALGKASLLLATEHWSEPVHRLQLRLQEAIVKDILRDDESYYPTLAGIDVSKFHPRDIMFSVDSDIDFAMNRTGALATYVLPIMRETGFYRRRLFTLSRRDELGSFLSSDHDAYPDPLDHYGYFAGRQGNLPMSPPHVSIIPVDSEADVANFNASEETADYFLPALKSRRLDPKFKDDAGRIHRLSEVDDNYASLMRQQMQYMKQAYVARIHLNKETKQLLIRDRNYDESLWQDALKRPRMSEEVFITLLNKTAETAANGSMARIDWMR